MKRQYVSSSDLSSIGYDESSQVLEIEFNNGGIYQYESVPPSVYQDLINASSIGQYFHRSIKNVYSCTKVG